MSSPSVSVSEELEQRNRLPTLLEVLGRRTLAPTDLFSFYIYMRDQQRSVDYLDFWLDVSQHMSLCRHYVRELRRSMLVETPELEKAPSKRTSEGLDNFRMDGDSPPNSEKLESQDQAVSDYLRSQNGNGKNGKAGHNNHSPRGSLGSRHSEIKAASLERPRPSFKNSDDTQTNSNSPGHTVARADIRASAEKILYTFVLPGSEREIVLPEMILNRIIHAIEEEGRDDPEVFNDAKEYVFQAMERDAFPGFLQAKALGNLVPLSVLLRLGLGLACLFAGLWGGYYMILTNKSRATRCWLIIPYLLGSHLLVAYQYKIDVFMAFFSYSEYTFMNWSKIREPYVRKLIMKRALMAFVLFHVIALLLLVLFIFVPGTNF
ncbi:hypothetical protein EPUS_00138 [Endocarpon pusillum Z07020]|uniref:RGS domain-containing protein n=1 Tax=Endocarpon pusillum (strain Z07020 / HMAS-L-300199) TaxID=1263415 RepID=U1HX17_ENDPU|nr:uncharacterized protein EPUS_00138 [Endocarpon pusillum Z07020]ERF75345.1 hypothetical protein EPUS_00138 [Endocarpon pusillum Z07020]